MGSSDRLAGPWAPGSVGIAEQATQVIILKELRQWLDDGKNIGTGLEIVVTTRRRCARGGI